MHSYNTFLRDLRAAQRASQVDPAAASRQRAFATHAAAERRRAGRAIGQAGYDDRPGSYTGDWEENFGLSVSRTEAREVYAEAAREQRDREAILAETERAIRWVAATDIDQWEGGMLALTEAHVQLRYYAQQVRDTAASLRAMKAGEPRPVEVMRDGFTIFLPAR